MTKKELITAPPQFHQVTLSVKAIAEMEISRGKNQIITAMVSVKMNKDLADKLLMLLNKQIGEYNGAGFVTFTLEGEFT